MLSPCPLVVPSGSGHALVCELAPAEPIAAENIRNLVWLSIRGSGRMGLVLGEPIDLPCRSNAVTSSICGCAALLGA
eukprot:5055228-Pyramimonas_sp.AAC.1